MELRDYIRVLRKQWRVLALCVLLTTGVAALLTLTATSQYRTTVKFFVSTPTDTTNSAYTGGLFSEQRAKSYADIVSGPATAEAVARVVTGTSADQLQGAITASVVPDTVLLEASVSDPSPVRALAIARAVSDVFPQMVADLEKTAEGGSPIKVTVVEQPTLPTTPYAPRPVRNLGLAVVLGLLLGVGLSVLRDSLDNTVKTPADVLELTGQATLGTIGFDENAGTHPLIVQDSPRSPRAEAFRQLRTNLQFVEVDSALRSLVMTSSVPKEGKSTTACNLALTLAQAGVRVCLVEGDLRRPRVADYLGLEGAVGLTSVLIGRVSLDDALQPWGDGTLDVLPSGPIPPNPSELLSSNGMADLMHALEQRFDLVIVDAPPLLPVTDGAILATLTDGAVLVARVATTRREQLGQAAAALQAVDAKILGVVLNMVPAKGPDSYGGYGYGYGYGYTTDTSKPHLSEEDSVRALDLSSTGAPARSPGIAARPRREQPLAAAKPG